MSEPRLYGVDVEDPDLYESPGTIISTGERIIETYQEVKESLKIYAGELYFWIYDDIRILSILRELAAKGVKVEIIVGPVISAGGAKKSPHILDLAREGVVRMYYRPMRGSFPPYQILDNQKLLLQPTREPLELLYKRMPVEEYSFKDDLNLFVNYAKKFSRYSYQKNLLLAPESELITIRFVKRLRDLVWLAEKCGWSYNNLTKNEIEPILREMDRFDRQTREKMKNVKTLWEMSSADLGSI